MQKKSMQNLQNILQIFILTTELTVGKSCIGIINQ